MSLQHPSFVKAEHAYRSAQIRQELVGAHVARELRHQRRQKKHEPRTQPEQHRPHGLALAFGRWYLG